MSMTIAILTVSDRCSQGITVDSSGPALGELSQRRLGATIVARACVPDEVDAIRKQIVEWTQLQPPPQLILTTGGTGLAQRDITPEATAGILQRRHPALLELARLRCYAKTPRAFLSRGEAGTVGGTLIINLPGSEKACTEYLEALCDVLPHAIQTLRGEAPDHGRADSQLALAQSAGGVIDPAGGTAGSATPPTGGQLVHAYILAGGKSSRFGSDKAMAIHQGRPLIQHVAEQLRPTARSITVVADRAGKYEQLNLRTIADVNPGRGPLAGLQAALHDCPAAGWLALVSCDLASLRVQWLRELMWRCQEGVRAVAFKGQNWEPLLALYHTSLRDEVDRRVADGTLAMQRLLDDVGAVAVPLPADWPEVSQVNTPEDLKRLGARGSLTVEVMLFGPYAARVGANRIAVTLPPDDHTCGALRRALSADARLASLLPASRVAVNHAFANDDRTLTSTDEVALIGMVSGG